MSSVGEMAKGLDEALQIVGRMEIEDARQWIEDNYRDSDAEEELTPGKVNFVQGFGSNPTRRWWHKEGNARMFGPG